MPAELDLEAYLRRIGLANRPTADLAGLQALHLAHAQTIPFENVDVVLGLPIRLDLPSLQEKLVRRRRGGYCFEQNTLFQSVLEGFGFEVAACEARVRLGVTGILPRTHMLLRVQVEGTPWLCDVGFGLEGLLQPVPLDGEAHAQFQNTYRVVPEAGLQVLQSFHRGAWEDLYAFVPEARLPIDFEVGNHFTSTHPDSRFRKNLIVQQPGPDVRRLLRNQAYAEFRGEEVVGREVALEELVPLLQEAFGLDLPEGPLLDWFRRGSGSLR
ncbi:MAG: arylamine N-acetyltransferase [Holophagaceae bacterium]|nr:arylamine N-acetyltransferase [Holophagaceae bacterium]